MIVSNSLPVTTTRTDWSFAYLPSTDATALADGSLTITEHHGKRIKRTISCRYGVQEQPARGCRCFLLLLEARTGDEDTTTGKTGVSRVGEVYRVTVAGQRIACSCKAGQTGRECKHGIALRELLTTGDIASPFENIDRDHGDTERQPVYQLPPDQEVF